MFTVAKTRTRVVSIYANVLCVGEGWLRQRLVSKPAPLPPAAPFRGENEQCCSASLQDLSAPRGESREEMLAGGRCGKLHIRRRASVQMPSQTGLHLHWLKPISSVRVLQTVQGYNFTLLRQINTSLCKSDLSCGLYTEHGLMCFRLLTGVTRWYQKHIHSFCKLTVTEL